MSAIAPHNFDDPLKLPSLPLEWHKALPAVSGVYLVLNSDKQVLYVGQSGNLQKRWKKHHLKKQLLEIGGIRLAWIELPDISSLDEREFSLIQQLTPPFNQKTTLVKRRSQAPLGLTLHCLLPVLMAKKMPHLTQKQLAQDTNLSPTTVNQLYRNKFTRVDVATVDAICNYFDCKVGELFVIKKRDII